MREENPPGRAERSKISLFAVSKPAACIGGPAGKCSLEKRKLTNNRKAQSHPVDDEQLQDKEEQARPHHNHAGGAWRYRAHRATENNGGRREVYNTHGGGERQENSAKVPLPRPLAAGLKFQRDRRHLQTPHEDVQYAEHAARNSKGKGRVERVKEGWSDVRASASKRGAATHDLRVRPAERHPSYAGKCSLRRTSCTETCKRESPAFRIPTIEKTRKEKTGKGSPLTHETTAHFHRSVALAGVSSGAAEKGPTVQCPRSAVVDGRRASRSWVVVTEEEVTMEVMEGRRSKGRSYPVDVPRAKEEVELLQEKRRRRRADGRSGRTVPSVARVYARRRMPPKTGSTLPPRVRAHIPLTSLRLDAEGGALTTTILPPGRWGGRLQGGVYARDGTAELLSAGGGPRHTGRVRMEHHGPEVGCAAGWGGRARSRCGRGARGLVAKRMGSRGCVLRRRAGQRPGGQAARRRAHLHGYRCTDAGVAVDVDECAMKPVRRGGSLLVSERRPAVVWDTTTVRRREVD
ncbi:hypothetical protein B0H16DRAFT_1473906 [Mycena metata]|uniref:Uncharacterized protein n=1 Tax=Mycena metata TaxID=1033252 RepID=A0AAD7MKU9_9AGAR|nr:hypothetical protein B0H16DRAFT_1473906 [Mycena metata]